MGIDKFNHEGYSDPTTYEALTKKITGAAPPSAELAPVI